MEKLFRRFLHSVLHPSLQTYGQIRLATVTRIRDYIGPFRLTRLIRVGNTTQVWEGMHEQEKKRYALKVLRPDFRKDRTEIGYLKHEFAVAKELKHPYIIKIHEFNGSEATPYLSMELYNAKNLKQVLREGTAELAAYVPKIVEQSAQSLYYFHQKDWIHCDIKPDNYLVSGEGETRLIDFTITVRKRKGISKLFSSIATNITRRFNTKTRGTRSYMSPEQIMGRAFDERADIYSFGCVLFELVAGKPPYTGNSPADLLKKHLVAQIPSAQVHNSNVTPEFNTLIRRMINKKPEDRPPSMWDFLKEFQSTRLFVKPPPPPKQKLTEDDLDEVEES